MRQHLGHKTIAACIILVIIVAVLDPMENFEIEVPFDTKKSSTLPQRFYCFLDYSFGFENLVLDLEDS